MVFDGDIANNNNYKSFEYKTKLLWNRAEDDANKILRNATISLPLKYLNKFWKFISNLNGQNIMLCLQLLLRMQMVIPIVLFSLSKTRNYMFL